VLSLFFPACRTNSVLHAGGEGENNSPPDVMLLGQADSGLALLVFFFSRPDWFWPSHVFVGQTDSGPSLLSRPGPTQTKIGDFVGPRSAQSLLG